MESSAPFVLLVLAVAVAKGADNRCYLENGGSVENFFASEDLPLGSLIGTLKVHGEVGPRGNIELRLEELDSPVLIEPGTKNLTLVKKLDKEGEVGISSVYIHILCTPKGSTDPIKIPVNIRVMDVNDNAPQFENGPYILNISEVTVVGTRVLQGVRARDKDQQGPFSTVQYTVLPGPNSDHFVFVNGLEGTLVLRKPLDFESLPNFTLTIRAQDQGNPPQYTDTLLYVNVIDADDQNPKFVHERYSTILPDHASEGTRLSIKPTEIAAFDQDLGIKSPLFYSFNTGLTEYKYFEIDRATGHFTIKKRIPEDEILQPVTLILRATQSDNRDRYALTTLTVSRPGTSLKELQFLQSHYIAGVLENVPLNSVLLTVITNRHRDKRLRYTLDAHEDMFNVLQNGDIVLKQHLDYETKDTYIFQVIATDSIMNATASVNITVLNVNDWDPRFRFPQYEFFVPELGELNDESVAVGMVEAADGDRGDKITLSLQGPAAKMFTIGEDGVIRTASLSALNSSTVHLVAVATDTGIPPRQASVPVIIHLPEAVVWRSGIGSNLLMFGVFGAILGLLALIILILIVYIHKHRQPKSKNQLSMNSQALTNIESEKLPPMVNNDNITLGIGIHSENNNLNGSSMNMRDNNLSLRNENMTFGNNVTSRDSNKTVKIENPMFTANITSNGGSPYTATVKSIMSRSTNSRQSQPPGGIKKAVAPSPPQIPSQKISSGSAIHTNRIWQAGSIPRTIKKLSWDDESETQQSVNKTEIDPDVSVTPINDMKSTENMNLTVYF
ncbi:protocadherin Fat 4 [Cimex lectularius]|uniref:Cadherin domain-containing protein n=1 Tax=Cimex lectularius TaxID=79782 RepID=A0A8I6RKF7_CIMLE|nr:protocadherin Fat 4 [Cimex lectularius]